MELISKNLKILKIFMNLKDLDKIGISIFFNNNNFKVLHRLQLNHTVKKLLKDMVKLKIIRLIGILKKVL